MSRETKKIEEIPHDESYLEELARKGDLDTFVNFITSLIVFFVVVAASVGILCYFSKKKDVKRYMGFDETIYIDLAEKTKIRLGLQKKINAEVRSNGFVPKPKPVRKTAAEKAKEAKEAKEALEAENKAKETPAGKEDQMNGEVITIEFGSS